MNVKALLCTIAMSLGGARYASAHPGHAHEARPEINEESAKVRAKEEVDRLVSKKKVPESWKDVAIKSMEKRTYKKGWEWVAIFEDAQAKVNKVLYVFLKPTGAFVAANFTGK
jgi:hypothetical protein